MSGDICLKIRKGRSKDIRYDFYPEAYWEVTGECGKKVILSPSYSLICEKLVEFRKHELKVDRTRQRKTYSSILIKQLESIVKNVKEVKLNEFRHIEDIYYECGKISR